MRFTLSTLLLPLGLLPLLIQGAPLRKERVAVTHKGIPIVSAGSVVLPGSDSGEDASEESNLDVGSEISQTVPASPPTLDVAGVGAGLGGTAVGLGAGLRGAAAGLAASIAASYNRVTAGTAGLDAGLGEAQVEGEAISAGT